MVVKRRRKRKFNCEKRVKREELRGIELVVRMRRRRKCN